MSFQNDPRLPGGAVGKVESPRSSKKWWIFGGCGCLSIIVLICVGVGAYVYLAFARPLVEFNNESVAIAQNSKQLGEALGPPIQFTDTGSPQATDAPGVVEFRTPVSGTKGSGTIVVRAKLEPGPQGFIWTREAMILEFDGKKIDLNPKQAEQESTPELKIDLGS